jgi:drug/metabolite transporter (DMT)-like permease
VYRNLFGGLVLLLVAAARRESLWKGLRPFSWAVMAGCLFAADIWFWHRSIIYVGPGLATIMGNFQVFILATTGVLVFGERATWRFYVSIPLAFLGLFLLVGIDWGSLDASYRVGVGFGLLTAVCYAGYLLIMRHAQRSPLRLSATSNLTLVSLVSAALLAVAVRVEGGDMRIPDAQTWWVLLAYGVLCQAMGWIVISRALRRVDASRAGLVLLLQPTLTFVWDVLFFDRPTTPIEVIGAAVALGAIYLGNTGRRRTAATATS